MLDTQVGWAIGASNPEADDHILVTSDGGRIWREVTPPEPAGAAGEPKVAVGAFLDAATGWVVYAYREFHIIPPSPVVWATHDGGQTWEPSRVLELLEVFEFFAPSNLTFIDSQHGWMMVHAGAGMMHDFMSLYRTQDGGQTWDAVVDAGSDQIQSCPKTDMAFADPNTGWITRDCSGVMDGAALDVTRDGGRTWDSVPLPAPDSQPDLFDPGSACAPSSPVLFSPQAGMLGVGCIVIDSEPLAHASYVYQTQDAGLTWRAAEYPGGALRFFDPHTGLALSRSLAKSDDGGSTWTVFKQVAWDGQFSFVDALHGWAVARQADQIALVITSDGGRTWQELLPRLAP